MKNIAIFPGSFDPFTSGHEKIVDRALPLFDQIIIAIGINTAKNSLVTLEQKLEQIKTIYKEQNKVQVIAYSSLTVDLAKEYNAKFSLRGVRSMADFEYERNIADINLKLENIETIFLFAQPEYAFISSSMVRELHAFGQDITTYLP